MWGQTLSRSYGRCIAEFLSEGSLVSLSLLDSSTCVGLRYGRHSHTYTCFSSQCLLQNRQINLTLTPFGFPLGWTDTYHESAPNISPWTVYKLCRFRNINLMSIAYAMRLGLGPTNPEMINMAQESLLLRPTWFSHVLWLLIPAFSLPAAPPDFPIWLHCWQERSSTTCNKLQIHVFGNTL